MNLVTPFVGVWIEINYNLQLSQLPIVTPFVGVWIEIIPQMMKRILDLEGHSLRGSVD